MNKIFIKKNYNKVARNKNSYSGTIRHKTPGAYDPATGSQTATYAGQVCAVIPMSLDSNEQSQYQELKKAKRKLSIFMGLEKIDYDSSWNETARTPDSLPFVPVEDDLLDYNSQTIKILKVKNDDLEKGCIYTIWGE